MKHLLLCLLLACCWQAKAQDRVQELLDRFDQKPEAATANRFFDELLKADFLDEKLAFPDNAPADSLCQQVWYWAAEWLYDQQQYDKAEQYALKALPKYHPSNPEKADCLNTLGCIYVRLSDFKQAANYAKQSVEIELQGGDHDRISSSMNTLAGIYMAGYQAKEAEQIILQALDHAGKVDNPGRKAIILGMASEIYHTLGNDQKALAHADQAIEIERQLDRQPKLAIRLSQKGSALLGLHRYQEAEAIYREVAPQLREMGDWHSYAIALNRLGMSLLCQKQQREAIPCYREAAGLFSKMGDLYNEIHAHRGLYECYWDINPDSAKIEMDLFDLLKDSLYTHATAEALSRYNAEFGNDLLQQENQEVRQAHQRTIILSVVAVVLIALLSWMLIRRQRRQQKQHIEALMHEIALLRKAAEAEKAEPLPENVSDAPLAAEEPVERADEKPATDSRLNDENRLFLMRVNKVVNEGLAAKQVGVESIASQLNMSVQTFRRRLQAAAGESPKTFISAIQMEKAGKLLLESPDMPIIQVASLCGFDEASTFAHTFKRVFGCSPSQYREQAR